MPSHFITLITLLITFITIITIKKIEPKINKKDDFRVKLLCFFLTIVVVIVASLKINHTYGFVKDINKLILANSGLFVIVLGFIFQEGLSTIVHGVIILMFKPFSVGDRLKITERNLTGIVESITLRHTVVRDVVTSASIIIPNDIIDKSIIENFHYTEAANTNFLDITIDYGEDIQLAMELIKQAIISHPLTLMPEQGEITVFLREMSASGLELRARSVITQTINENFIACSDIKIEVLKLFKENNIKIPYTHRTIDGNINVKLKND